MNPYINPDRIEFPVTFRCTGKCKHCSEGEKLSDSTHIDGATAADAVLRLCGEYDMKSVMTFGGEPLLYADAVCQIHNAAAKMNVPQRQLITNGFFSKDKNKIKEVSAKLCKSGVNAVLLSADAFHQEHIPIEPVLFFAEAVKSFGVNIRTHPAWLINKEDPNPYNICTAEILRKFEASGIYQSDGNVIFPSGNALKYLSDYFDTDKTYENPYEQDPFNISTISVSPNGDVLGGNVYDTDILEIINNYIPKE